ncbi:MULTISPECIES: hypothetical protein [unclassified Rhizobium]|uniref:hypothetical protein n=1 Tax=unclassified Rhizobium TaxID=2613769 RepID=UPI000AD53E38|nr:MULTISPECIES: hypothetical protein [unclassified Rhizobium]
MEPELAHLFAPGLKNIIYLSEIDDERPRSSGFSSIPHSTNSGFSRNCSASCDRTALVAMRGKVVCLKAP